MKTVEVLDYTPDQLRARHQQQSQKTSDQETIFSNMSDGIVVLEHALTLAGYEHKARQFVINVAALLSDDDAALSKKDDDLAKHLKCTRETIVRWRQAYKQTVLAKKFAFLVISEGDYIQSEKRYEQTAYELNLHIKEFVETAVATARASSLYAEDRLASLAQAAGHAYDNIPDAPVRHRFRKNTARRNKDDKSVLRAVRVAAESLVTSKTNLQDLQPKTREQLLRFQSGEIREKLLEMQQEIAAYLTMLPQAIENKEVAEGCDFRSHPSATVTATDNQDARNGGCHSKAEGFTVTSTVAVEAACESTTDLFEKLDARLCAPRVQTVKVQLCPPDTSPPAESQPDLDELAEAEAVRLEACRLPVNSSPQSASPPMQKTNWFKDKNERKTYGY
jgi:hypothetical protein